VGAEADRPLAGIGIVVTREEDEDGPLAASFRRLGARVLRWPTVRTAPADPEPVQAEMSRLHSYDWVVFTSPRAVAAVTAAVTEPPAGMAAARVAAVGEATARAAAAAGWTVHLIPAVQTAAALVPALARAGVGPGTRVLFPASEIAREPLEKGLAELGAEVTRVTAYRTVPTALDVESSAAALDDPSVRVITFTSPSAIEGLRSALGEAVFRAAADRLVMATIGPTTASAARAAGAARVIEARDHSLDGLVDRVTEWANRDDS
jgi:uroporphyrinogen-III synthase